MNDWVKGCIWERIQVRIIMKLEHKRRGYLNTHLGNTTPYCVHSWAFGGIQAPAAAGTIAGAASTSLTLSKVTCIFGGWLLTSLRTFSLKHLALAARGCSLTTEVCPAYAPCRPEALESWGKSQSHLQTMRDMSSWLNGPWGDSSGMWDAVFQKLPAGLRHSCPRW